MSAAYSSVGDRASRLVPVSARASVAIGLVSLVGLASFLWPLLVVPGSGFADATTAPLLLAALLPLFLVVVLAKVGRGGFDVKAIAMLGVLSAVGAVLRPLGAGTAGLETVFFLLILAGRVYGPGFGFVLGATTMFSSALLTGGVGPWLPFQMMAAAWVGLGAGLLPRVRGKAEICMLGAYGFVAGLVFGLLMNLSFWPFTVGLESQLSFEAGAPALENLHRFLVFNLVTSLGWDIGRAATNLVAILLIGPAVLSALRRIARRAAFDRVADPGAASTREAVTADTTRDHE